MITKFSKQFFWLFAIIGFFLSLFLVVNEYFSHQIFIEEYERQMNFCIESNQKCDIDRLINIKNENLNPNQLKLIELNTLITNFNTYHDITRSTYIFLFELFRCHLELCELCINEHYI